MLQIFLRRFSLNSVKVNVPNNQYKNVFKLIQYFLYSKCTKMANDKIKMNYKLLFY